MPVGAAIAGATISAAGAVGAAHLANKGASAAANAQTQAANSANATQLQIFNQQRADSEPWRQVGGQALNLMGQLYGFTPTFNATTPGQAPTTGPGTGAQTVQQQLAAAGIRLGDRQQQQLNAAIASGGAGSDLAQTLANAGIVLGSGQQRAFAAYRPEQSTSPQASGEPATTSPTTAAGATNPTEWLSRMPGYQFRMNEGTKALNTSWAANGMRESGAAEKALLRYGQDYASNEFNNEWNRLAGLAGVGQAVNNSNNALAQNYASQTGANTMNAAASRASSYAQQGQNNANAFGYAAGRISNLPWDSWGQTSGGSYGGGHSGGSIGGSGGLGSTSRWT